jgi:hypothetical protein
VDSQLSFRHQCEQSLLQLSFCFLCEFDGTEGAGSLTRQRLEPKRSTLTPNQRSSFQDRKHENVSTRVLLAKQLVAVLSHLDFTIFWPDSCIDVWRGACGVSQPDRSKEGCSFAQTQCCLTQKIRQTLF